MFKAIISRDNGCPWGETGMTSGKWLDIPTTLVPIRELIATQPGVLLHALSDEAPTPVGGDRFPHVIRWQGSLYLEDGHHRVVRARLNGRRAVRARVLALSDSE
jgi:hypothetical protein